ncbi:MAG TPA: hypothetical protein VFH50_03750 [Acidimicrobiales bacterium]|nr:hypothetical protein [Acidimicrobiales bacterium]
MHRWIGGPLLLGSLAVGLAACGGSGGSGSAGSGPPDNGEAAKPVHQIGQDVEAAMKGLKSFHIAGSVTDTGQTIGLDLVVENSGPGGGKMTIDGSAFQLVVNGSKIYFKGDQSFWQKAGGVNASVAGLFAGKWVTGVPGSSDLEGLAQLTNVNSFVSGLASGSDSGTNATKGAVSTFRGQRALPIRSSEGTAWVAATGKPYLLALEGGSQANLTFDEFNSAPAPAVPSNAVDFGNLSGS